MQIIDANSEVAPSEQQKVSKNKHFPRSLTSSMFLQWQMINPLDKRKSDKNEIKWKRYQIIASALHFQAHFFTAKAFISFF